MVADKKMTFAETQKEIAARWQALTEAEKGKWAEKLEGRRAEYAKQREVWLATLTEEQRVDFHRKERASKRRKSRERLRAPQKPTAYRLFLETFLPDLEDRQPDSERPDLIKHLKQQWKDMSEEQQQPFRERAKQAMVEYHRQCLEYDDKVRLLQSQQRGRQNVQVDKDKFSLDDEEEEEEEDDPDAHTHHPHHSHHSHHHDHALAMAISAAVGMPPTLPAADSIVPPPVPIGSMGPPIPLELHLFSTHPGHHSGVGML